MDFTLQQLLKEAASYLNLKGKSSSRSDAELILSFLLGKEKSFFYAHGDLPLESNKAEEYRRLVKRRGEGEPLAYITGQKEFMGFPFVVKRGVLVPRPETEHLVEYVIVWLQKYKPRHKDGAGLKILDLGTGCGNIALTLARYFPAAKIVALDKDEHALRVATMNSKKLQVGDRMEFFCGRLRELLQKHSYRFDAIVSNPPYIPTEQLTTLSPEVQMEPRQALDGGADGLNIYREIFRDVSKCLHSPGILALEVGKGQANQICALAEERGSWREIIVLKDYAGIKRVCCFTL
jgi:release factor glutamine methyltransferase